MAYATRFEFDVVGCKKGVQCNTIFFVTSFCVSDEDHRGDVGQ